MSYFNIWLAGRLLLSKKKVGFVSISGLVSMIGLAIGSFALVISIAVLNGFEKEIRQKIIGFESDLRITANSINENTRKTIESALQSVRGIQDYSFFLERKGIAMSEMERSLILIKAVQDGGLERVYNINKGGESVSSSGLPLAYIGKGLADDLGVQMGDKLKLVSPLDTQIFSGFPSTVVVEVGAIFETDIFDFDDRYCFVPLAIGQALFKKFGMVQGVDIRLSGEVNKKQVVEQLRSILPPGLTLSTWEELHQTLFSAMRMEKFGSIFVLSLIIVIASFNLVSTLVMLVIEKVREIGILRTLGVSRSRIKKIFGIQGIMIGSIGLAVGLFLGLLFVLVQQKWGIIPLPGDIYFIDSLPVSIEWFDIATIVVVAVVLIIGAIIYPAQVAGRLSLREAIHFEK